MFVIRIIVEMTGKANPVAEPARTDDRLRYEKRSVLYRLAEYQIIMPDPACGEMWGIAVKTDLVGETVCHTRQGFVLLKRYYFG